MRGDLAVIGSRDTPGLLAKIFQATGHSGFLQGLRQPRKASDVGCHCHILSGNGKTGLFPLDCLIHIPERPLAARHERKLLPVQAEHAIVGLRAEIDIRTDVVAVTVIYLRCQSVAPPGLNQAFGHRVSTNRIPLAHLPEEVQPVIVLVHPFRFQHLAEIRFDLLRNGRQLIRLIRPCRGQQHRRHCGLLAHDVFRLFTDAVSTFPLLDLLAVGPEDIPCVDSQLRPMIFKAKTDQIAANPYSIPLRLTPQDCPVGPNPLCRIAGIVNHHLLTTAGARNPGLMLQDPSLYGVFAATAVTAAVLKLHPLFLPAGPDHQLLGVRHPEEHGIVALSQNLLFKIFRRFRQTFQGFLGFLSLSGIALFTLFPVMCGKGILHDLNQISVPAGFKIGPKQFRFLAGCRQINAPTQDTTRANVDSTGIQLPSGRVLFVPKFPCPVIAAKPPDDERGLCPVPNGHGQGLSLDVPACALPLGNRHTQPGIQFRPLRFRGVKL